MNSSDNQSRFSKKKARGSFAAFLSGLKPKKRNARISADEADKNLVYSLSTRAIPNRKQFKYLGRFVSRREKAIILICGIFALLALGYLGVNFFKKHISLSPAYGGSFAEGVVGFPKYINPLYSENRDVDQDLAKLIFSSLFTHDNQGRIIGDLAESWTTSDDHKEYYIKLRDGARWHNGEPITADDVIFTFNSIKDPEYNSSLRKQLSGIEIEKVDDANLKIRLSEPYAGALDLLTFFIMPSSLWSTATPSSITLSELNIRPVGSGQYKFKELVKNNDGEIKEYILEANNDYYGKIPFIKEISFKFYADRNSAISALNSNQIDSVAYVAPSEIKDVMAKNSLVFHYLPIAQVDSLFFNSAKNSYLGDKNIKAAIMSALSREEIIEAIDGGKYFVNYGPLPVSSYAYQDASLSVSSYDLEKSRQILSDAGWENLEISQSDIDGYDSLDQYGMVKLTIDQAKKDGFDPLGKWLIKKPAKAKQAPAVLDISIKYPSGSENEAAVNKIKEELEAVGIRTNVKSSSPADLENIAKSGEFEALFFGQFVGHDPDISVFWHSSQIGQGLNIVNYKNSDVDSKLMAARSSFGVDARTALYKEIQSLVASDAPAAFLYTPSYAYVTSRQIKGIGDKQVAQPADRFADISQWYIKTRSHFDW